MSHRAPWPHNHAAGPWEVLQLHSLPYQILPHETRPHETRPQGTLPHRTPGASRSGLAEPASRAAFVEYIRLEEPGLVGETEFPPPPEVLDRVLDGLRKLG